MFKAMLPTLIVLLWVLDGTRLVAWSAFVIVAVWAIVRWREERC